jgi:uncharacterized membrane protein YbhN (UPF0104 family)
MARGSTPSRRSADRRLVVDARTPETPLEREPAAVWRAASRIPTPGGRSGLALAAFASAGDEERRRRPADAVVLLAAALLVLATALDHREPTELAREATETLQALPAWIVTLLGGAFALSGIYALGLILLAVAAGDRPRLIRDLVTAALFAAVIAVVGGHAVAGAWPRLLGRVDAGEATFPVVAVAVVTAVCLTGGPHLVRPARHLGLALLAGAAAGSVALELGDLSDALAGFATGAAAAAAIRLWFGSPLGAPSRHRVRLALAQLGLEVHGLVQVADAPDRKLVLEGEDEDGWLTVRVAGRDAADSRLLTELWRFIWYRDSGPTLALTRLQQIEHEALLLLLAQRAGVRTPDLVAATATERGDALLVVRGPGHPLLPAHDLTPTQVGEAWEQLAHLRKAGISHGRIDAEHLVLTPDGAVAWAGWGSASVEPDLDRLNGDAAALLVLSALAIGAEAAAGVAVRALGSVELTEAVPYVQKAALTGALRTEAREAELDLEALRHAAASAAGTEPEEVVRLRRVSLGQLATTALFALAVWLLVSQLADIGVDTIVDALSSAAVPWLLVALVVGQIPRISTAVGTLGSSPHPLALGPTIALQFAVTFINLAVPSTAARIATVTRYFQKQGATATTALTAGAIDGAAGFVVQVSILAVTLGFGFADLDFDIDRPDTGDHVGPLLAVVIGLFLAAVVAMAVVPSLRAKVLHILRDVRTAIGGLRSPRRLALLFGGNLGGEVLFSMTLGVSALAYGHTVPLASLLAINVGVALFAGLMPVPGGMGVTEGALTVGLVAAGVPEADALATALTYRAVTFYLPPLWGYGALRWLTRNDYL